MTSSWAGEEMAATTRMRSPQEEHSLGSESQVRAMRRAQLRLRFRTNPPSSSRAGRGVVDRGLLDPAGLLAERGGEGAIGADGHFVPQRDVRDEEGEEVEGGEELVVAAEAGVEAGPLVVDQAL